MIAIDAASGIGFPLHAAHDIPADRTIVATVIQWRDKIALFRRSGDLGHDSGLWHCITGFMEAGATPEQQTLEKIFEETGLQKSCGRDWSSYITTTMHFFRWLEGEVQFEPAGILPRRARDRIR